MNVVTQIQGRDAIPVRALPWMTGWWFGAQEVAEALTQDKENYPEFSRMQAYRQKGDIVEPVSGREWRNTVTYAIQTISDKDLPADQWRRDATVALPADVFVWRDEWETAYNQSPDGPGIMTAQRSDLMASLPHAAMDMTPDELQRWNQCVPGFLPDALNNLKPDEFPAFDDDDSQDIEDRTLNFAPDIPQHLVRLVMEVFTQREAQTPAPAQIQATPAPAVATSDVPKPLTTSEIAGSFAGFHNKWDSDKWKKNLQDPAPWLKACQHQGGNQGKPFVESTWWPVQIAQALDKKHKGIRSALHKRFKNQEPLKPWLESLENNLPDDSEA